MLKFDGHEMLECNISIKVARNGFYITGLILVTNGIVVDEYDTQLVADSLTLKEQIGEMIENLLSGRPSIFRK